MNTNHEQSESSDNRALLAERWHQCQPSISAYLFASVPNFHDAEDLLQQVAVAVARDFDKYDPDTPFIRWAIAIARNRVLNYRRTAAMSKVVFSQETVDSLADVVPSTPTRASDFKAALERCIAKLQDRARQVLALRYEEDLRSRHIANRLDMSANAVSVLLHRTRKTVAQCVKTSLNEA